MLTIGKVAAHAKVTPDTLRYYEREKLLLPSAKTAAGYRLYNGEAVRSIQFIRHAQECGFTLGEIRELLRLRGSVNVSCSDIRLRAQEKRFQLADRIRTMQAMCRTLDRLIAECDEPKQTAGNCPILTGLERAGERGGA
jgi:DNA-binding transcriptional MerR regulator